jgi:hypothetical protein
MRRLGVIVIAALVSACAPLEPIIGPVVAYKTGLTITIRNPFDCNEQTALVCSEGNLDFQCRCSPARPTAERSSLVHEVQTLVNSADDAAAP